MTNCADPDHLASEEAIWSGSTLFAMAGYSQLQQDKGQQAGERKSADKRGKLHNVESYFSKKKKKSKIK